MRTLVHLSDLHFGSTRNELLEPLVDAVRRIGPSLIAVSGDLTQRARPEQFREARAFLDRFAAPRMVVPGNHDIPLYNLFARFRGLVAYRRHLAPELEPFYRDQEIAALGINTARALAFKDGRINKQQAARAASLLAGHPAELTKIIVSHHPFDLPETYRRRVLVGRAQMAIRRLNQCKVDVYLAGHYHISGAAPTAFQVRVDGYSSLIVQAGTALSDRTRGEPNTFNAIRIELPRMSLERHQWDEARGIFTVAETSHFQRGPSGWSRVSSPE
jgi:3',5'-cyclic AMP phosphodiesterase CpdA